MSTFQLSSFAMPMKAPAEPVPLRLFGSELAARDYFPLLRWMIFTGVTLFGFAIAWRYRLFQLMTAQDQSGISLFICLLYVAISGHCLASIIAVSREINTAHRVRDRVMNGVTAYRAEGRRVVIDNGVPLPAGRITDYIRNLVVKAEKQGRERRLDQTLLLRGLADKLRSPMQFGAFAGDALLKLGLLGTIVGFILMLLPLATLENFDAASMKSSMKVMSGGMAVAMYTTLAGLIGSILVKAQYYILDNASAYLFDVTTDLTEVFVVSTLEQEAHGGV
jgi:MotA/TolQ/ExbB proton channel family